MKFNKWAKTLLILFITFAAAYFSPSAPIDPWKVLSLKKLFFLIFALSFIQALGVLFGEYMGVKASSLLNGFLGGLISSTATTASLAQASKTSSLKNVTTQTLTYLSTTTAMLLQGVVIILFGNKEINWSLMWIISGPLLTTIGFILFLSHKLKEECVEIKKATFNLISILKLSGFIILIISLSKFLQITFGQYGIMAFTFFVSLFEIHGSIIANLQLHEGGDIKIKQLGTLVAISIFASYVSKLFLVITLGSKELKIKVFKYSVLLSLSLLLSWGLFYLWVPET